MAYEPTVWDCGDVVTADLLNKIEEAIAALSDSIDDLEARVTALENA